VGFHSFSAILQTAISPSTFINPELKSLAVLKALPLISVPEVVLVLIEIP